jgi:hypothetical protein
MATLLVTRRTATDDDGTGTTGTVWNNAYFQALYDEVDDYVQASVAGVCQGRITLTTAVPVTTSDVTAATTVRFAPYKGYRVGLYDGSEWKLYTFTELSLSLGSDAADTNYDLFAYNSSGTVTIERLAWTNATTRATALTTQNGVLVKSGQTTRRYLGTYRTTGTVGQTEDSFAKRFVWNYHNRVRRGLRVTECTDTWTYSTATIRQVNASTANQVAVVVGWAEALIDLEAFHRATNNSGVLTTIMTGIGEDSTTGSASGCLIQSGAVGVDADAAVPGASLRKYPAVGYHYYPWLEYSGANATTTWYGDAATPTVVQSGLHGAIEG